MPIDERVDKTLNVRLKFFLARQLERRRQTENITPQQAAILASLMWMEKPGSLNQVEICRLLGGVKQTRMTTVFKSLLSRGLVKKEKKDSRGNWYRITSEGRTQTLRFADEVLGSPKEVENEMFKGSEYMNRVASADKLIDEFLRKHFLAAKTKMAVTRTMATEADVQEKQ